MGLAWLVYALGALLGNIAVGITGLGHAIFFIFIFQIAVLSGFDERDFKYTVFLQALALLIAQPLLLRNSNIIRNANRQLLWLFVPATIVSTPIGNMVADAADTSILQIVGGTLVMIIGLRELIKGRNQLQQLFCGDYSIKPAEIFMKERETLSSTDSGVSDVSHTLELADISTMNLLTINEETKVFFMIGSQRSGSNWLRTIIDQRDDIAGPHPPHILREFEPLLEKFGHLQDADNIENLVDHVLLFVERNQVTWVDRNDSPIKFHRDDAADYVQQKMKTLTASGIAEDQLGIYILISLMDYTYSFFAQQNDKTTFLCKSMGMSKYHKQLQNYFGSQRLRYIYLVRDPRDVTLSFQKAPVGDKHIYTILKKWCKLQDQVIPILDDAPNQIHFISYEDMLTNKVEEITRLNKFIGGARQGSDLPQHDSRTLINNAANCKSTSSISRLSSQFQNLTKGDEFQKTQKQKWRSEMTSEDLTIAESVAYATMIRLGYTPSVVDSETKIVNYSNEDIATFVAENARWVEASLSNLRSENPLDIARRQFQKEVLTLEAEPICHSMRIATQPQPKESDAAINTSVDGKPTDEIAVPFPKDEICQAEDKSTKWQQLTTRQKAFTITMGALSGFLGGLCGIRGPPMIIFFMHSPVDLSSSAQRATSTAVTFCNVVVRVIYYIVTSTTKNSNRFTDRDADIYIAVGVCSLVGPYLGQFYFKRKLANQKEKIRAILSIPLAVCGITLLIFGFGSY